MSIFFSIKKETNPPLEYDEQLMRIHLYRPAVRAMMGMRMMRRAVMNYPVMVNHTMMNYPVMHGMPVMYMGPVMRMMRMPLHRLGKNSAAHHKDQQARKEIVFHTG